MKQFLVLVFSALVFFGCKKNSPSPLTEPAASAEFIIAPSDNETNVSQNVSIVLSFNKSVDTKVVENNFRLINELAYVDSLCPVSKTMNHGSMMMSMKDSMKMNHMDSIHGLKGTFTWSGDSKTCVFKPDTLLRPGMQHMVHMGEETAKMMESAMGTMGMMGQSGMGSGMGMAFHFYTKTADGSSGGHASHHP
jgi:hypothetical protein